MSEQTKTAEQLATETKAAFEKSLDAVREIAENALGKAKSGESVSQGLKEKADEALVGLNELKASVAALEQKAARGGGDVDHRSVGQRFAESDEFKEFAANGRKGSSASMMVKTSDLTTTIGDPLPAGSVAAGIVPNRVGLIELPRRAMTIRQLLMPGRTTSPIVEYERETGFTNSAAPVAEGALKPQSTMQIEDVQTRTKVIAHWFRVSRQALSDVAQIASLVDTRLRYGLDFREEQQLLFGDGTGENLHGLVPQATAFSAAFSPASETPIDRLRLAILQVALAEYPANGIVLNATDWARIELTKDSTGRYIIGNPQDGTAATLWRLPVVDTLSMTANTFLTGAFNMGAQIFDQDEARVETGYQNDDFTRNKVTMLGEKRVALATYRPEAFVTGQVVPSGG